jgi:hypothetical protein
MGAINGVSNYGLYSDDNLVALMSVRFSKGVLDISRFCCLLDTSISGAFSKLLNYVEQLYKPNKVINFVDYRYSTGISSLLSGFSLDTVTLGFSWTDGKSLFNRRYCKADPVNKLSESEKAKQMGLYKIYDAGQAKLIKSISHN